MEGTMNCASIKTIIEKEEEIHQIFAKKWKGFNAN